MRPVPESEATRRAGSGFSPRSAHPHVSLTKRPDGSGALWNSSLCLATPNPKVVGMDDDFFVLESPVDGSQIEVVREALGLTQIQLADLLGHRDDGRLIRYWQAGKKRPTPSSLELIQEKTGFAPMFFAPRSFLRDEEPLFHKLRSTSAESVRRSRGYFHLAADLAHATRDVGMPPLASIPDLSALEPEPAATALRQLWRLGAGPVPNVVAAAESGGVTFARIPALDRSIYSFSGSVGDAHLVLQNPVAADRYVARFYSAHELGHLALHRSPAGPHAESRGSKGPREVAADEFAAAFLMPSADIAADLDLGLREWRSEVMWRRLAVMSRDVAT